jgi:hypothetical protein
MRLRTAGGSNRDYYDFECDCFIESLSRRPSWGAFLSLATSRRRRRRRCLLPPHALSRVSANRMKTRKTVSNKPQVFWVICKTQQKFLLKKPRYCRASSVKHRRIS